MPILDVNISDDLFNFLKDRFKLTPGVDASGKTTNKPEEMKVFSFDFKNAAQRELGCVVLSLLDDAESRDSVKVYFGQELAELTGDEQTEWYEFLKEIRQFAKSHMLGFDVRNLNHPTITKRDIEPMFESTFSPIEGSVKTSKQSLDNATLVIKHSARIDPAIKNARSRKIDRIYVTTRSGEKFLLPFKMLLAARAMARHVNNGGTPYDAIGKNITQMVEELVSLRRFARTLQHKNLNPEQSTAIVSVQNRVDAIKRTLTSLISDRGYSTNHAQLQVDDTEYTDEYSDLFDGVDLDEKNTEALPYVIKSYNNRPTISPEEEQLTEWISEEIVQKYTSEKTSVNQLPRVFRLVDWKPDTINLDFGGGKFDQGTNFLRTRGVQNVIIDLNRTPEHNTAMRELLSKHPADTATCANVLNVIFEPEVRVNILKEIYKYLKPGGSLYLIVYEGDKSGEGRETNKGWQEHRPTASYLSEVKQVFPSATIIKNMIVATKTVNEGDVMAGYFPSPITFPDFKLFDRFRSKKQLDKKTDTSGKLSPLSLLNTTDQEKDQK